MIDTQREEAISYLMNRRDKLIRQIAEAENLLAQLEPENNVTFTDHGRRKEIVAMRRQMLQMLAEGFDIRTASMQLHMVHTNAEYHLARLKKWNRCRTTYQLLALAVSTKYVTFSRAREVEAFIQTATP